MPDVPDLPAVPAVPAVPDEPDEPDDGPVGHAHRSGRGRRADTSPRRVHRAAAGPLRRAVVPLRRAVDPFRRRGTECLPGNAGRLALCLLSVLAVQHVAGPAASRSAFSADFPQRRRLITNEVAYFDPASHAPVDRNWIVTSGSLFGDAGTGWTGPIDAEQPDTLSRVHTDSAVFRLVTRRSDFRDVAVRFEFDLAGLTSTPRTPAQTYDGLHVFLRYGSAQQLYAVSVFRRDGLVVVKKKTPGGPVNGGDYVTLASARAPVPTRRWNAATVTIRTSGGRTRFALTLNGKLVLQAVDTGARLGPALTAAGRVGLRGDNADFRFRRFTATPL